MEFIVSNFLWIFTLILVVFILVYKKATKNPYALTSKYKAEKTIHGNPAENLNRIMEALKNAGFKKVGLDRGENRFYAQAKFSIYSWSEYIEVSYEHHHFSTQLHFISICALPTQIVAWGKNKRNFLKFQKELDKLVPASTWANAS